MYTQAQSPPAPSGLYRSPPPQGPPYRVSPVSLPPRPPYTFSPPPPGQQGVPYQPNVSTRGQHPPYPPYSGQRPPNPHANVPPTKHKGTLAPGQLVQVGEHIVRVERYLSEGGYAHVYLTTSEKPIYPPAKQSKGRWGERGYTQHCLKRIAFQDEKVWADVRKEIEVMKALPPNPHLTQYLGSAHTKSPRGGYEVYILMEFCSGGGIIDLLNKRLRDRLKEIEILNIFTDVCEAVAAMHASKQPLLHRDLKIENVLSSPSGQPPTPQRPTPLIFKLCDFGSTTFPATSPPSTKLESEALALDLNKNTTLQYRSPEMVEPMLGHAIGLPSDVWALGVLLYKLCYYTTPFEEHGTLAIVNAKYTFPQYPMYSPRLQHLIASMLVEQPLRRPTVFEVLKQAHEMSGTRPEIDYPTPSRALGHTSSSRPPQQVQPNPANLLDFTSSTSPVSSTPVMQPTIASTVHPQRRGRPTPKQNTYQHQAGSPNPPTIDVESSYRSAPKLQVTGEAKKTQEAGQTSPKSGTVDAFGLPSQVRATSKSASGFSDSFAALSPPTKDRDALRHPSRGFTDAFTGDVVPNNNGNQPRAAHPPGAPASFGLPRRASPTSVPTIHRESSRSSVPTVDGDTSFETRFPSIETLSSTDSFSPADTSTQKPDATSATMSPPPMIAKPSYKGNLTGGDMANHHVASGWTVPQPRSTHVTGTAFKGLQDDLLSPGPVPAIPTSSSFGSAPAGRDYFDSVETKSLRSPSLSAKSPLPEDLLTGNDETLGGATLGGARPTPLLESAPQAISHLPQTTPTSGQSRASLPEASRPPETSAPKSSGHIDSQEWSPLEDLRATSKNSSSQKDDVSSDEEGPGSAVRRPVSAQQRRHSPSAEAEDDLAKLRIRAEGSSRSNTTETTESRPSRRPVSMFDMSYPPGAIRSGGLKTPSPDRSPVEGSAGVDRPRHVRKGSINDIVSRYESLATPAVASSITSKAGKKPSVAAKPASLRQSTMETTKPSSSAPPPKPAKPDVMKPTAVRHGEAPQATAWSRASSGRAFPTSQRPAEFARPSSPGDRTNGSSSRSSSPDKQQSVNSLIQRWNQGSVGEKKTVKKSGYI